MADQYGTFAALKAVEKLGVDYQIRAQDRLTPIAVIAPHGGSIEPGTSQIAEAICGDNLSFYAFEGLRKGRSHRELHITSSKFDEPQAIDLVGRTKTIVAIHGRANDGTASIWMGGRDAELRDRIIAALTSEGFDAVVDTEHLPALSQSNICNRGTSAAGVQLELPRSLRNQLLADPNRLKAFADAVRYAIAERGPETEAFGSKVGQRAS